MSDESGSVAAARRNVAQRADDLAALTPGRTGNCSVRFDDRIAITPSGVPYDEIDPDGVPVVDLDGGRLAGDAEPSSETPLHAAVYDATEAGAVVHVHSPWATTFAVLRRPVPPVHYMVSLAGGTVPVADYATYGTPELAATVVETLTDHDVRACLLANHGVVAIGDDLDDAFEVARAVESTAALAGRASAVGDPVALTGTQIEAAAEQFATYGQPDA